MLHSLSDRIHICLRNPMWDHTYSIARQNILLTTHDSLTVFQSLLHSHKSIRIPASKGFLLHEALHPSSVHNPHRQQFRFQKQHEVHTKDSPLCDVYNNHSRNRHFRLPICLLPRLFPCPLKVRQSLRPLSHSERQMLQYLKAVRYRKHPFHPLRKYRAAYYFHRLHPAVLSLEDTPRHPSTAAKRP